MYCYALNYLCGGADYPELFGNWELTEEDQARRRERLRLRFRGTADDVVFSPGAYGEMMATSPEMQVAGDWMLAPSARQLD